MDTQQVPNCSLSTQHPPPPQSGRNCCGQELLDSKLSLLDPGHISQPGLVVLVPGPSILVPVSELDLALLSGPIFHHLFLPLNATEPQGSRGCYRG